MALLRRTRRLYVGPQQTLFGQWLRALLLRHIKIAKQISDRVDRSVWEEDGIAVAQATFEIAVERYFRTIPDEHQLHQWIDEVRAMFGERVPRSSDIEALILTTLGAQHQAIDHIDTNTRLTTYGVVLGLITRKLSMTEPAIDQLILDGERLAIDRGWHPHPAPNAERNDDR